MPPSISFPHLGIEIATLDRVAFSIFGVGIYWYALFIIAGILAGLATALREAKRTGQNPERYWEILSYGVIAAIIGLRLFFVLFNWELYVNDPIRIITGIRYGGLAIWGGIIAAIGTGIVLSRVRKMDAWLVLDTGMPSFAIGQAIGRFGNFVNREAFGGYTDNIFAMRLAVEEVRGTIPPELLERSILDRGVEFIQVHPTFLYESLASFALFAALTLYRPHKKFGGEIFWLYLVGYGTARFLIEQLRTDPLLLWGTELRASAIMALAAVIVGIIGVVRGRLRSKTFHTTKPK